METITISRTEYDLLKSKEQIYQLISKKIFSSLSDENINSLIKEIQEKNDINEDWYNLLTDFEKNEIELGLEDVKNNRFVTTKEIQEFNEKWLILNVETLHATSC